MIIQIEITDYRGLPVWFKTDQRKLDMFDKVTRACDQSIKAVFNDMSSVSVHFTLREEDH